MHFKGKTEKFQALGRIRLTRGQNSPHNFSHKEKKIIKTILIKSFCRCFTGSRGDGFFEKSPPLPPGRDNSNQLRYNLLTIKYS